MFGTGISTNKLKLKKYICILLAAFVMFSFMQVMYFPSYPVFAAELSDTWTLQTSNTTTAINGITYGNGLFVAVGDNRLILTSPDAINWTIQTDIGSPGVYGIENIQSVTYGNGTFVACTSRSTIITSDNGINWQHRGQVVSNSLPLWSVTYGNGVFVAVGSWGKIYTSTDGINWTLKNSGLGWGENIKSVTYGKDQSNQDTFVASYTSSKILSSKDNGESWEINSSGSTIDNGLNFACYGDGKFLVGGGTDFIATSGDGQNWAVGNSRTNAMLNAAAYGNNAFIMVGSKDYSSNEFSIFASTDSYDWHKISVTGIGYDLNDVAFGNGVFVAVGYNGSILTSTISGTKARLGNLTVGNGTLRPGFNSFGMYYMDYIDIGTTSTTITATAASAGDTISINGVPQESGIPKTIELAPGANAINIVVTSQDNTVQNTYRVMLNRLANRLISSGQYHAIVCKSDGTYVSWGTYDNGEPLILPELSGIIQVAAGLDHSLALKSDGSVAGWGNDRVGQATPPEGLVNVSCIDAGALHSLALKSDGTVAGWGGTPTPIPAEDIYNIIAIDSGYDYNIALRADDTFIGWGDNYMNKTKAPVGLRYIADISAGKDHTLALKADGTVMAWGYNNQGQTDVPAGLSDVIDVEAGAHHSVALKADGTVVVWGGTQDSRIAAVPEGLNNVIEISANEGYTMALKSDGTIVIWGNRGLVTSMPAGLNLFNPPTMTDAEAVAADSESLTFDTIKGNNTAIDDINYDLNLPSSGSNGTTITWSSTNPAVLNTDGAVTRPESGSADAAVSITAYITKGESTVTKTFSLIVKVMPAVPAPVSFLEAVNYEVGGQPYAITAGDFNNDGKTDLAVTNGNTNNFSVLLGKGDGTFQPKSDYGPIYAPLWITAGQFNNDSILDIAVTNSEGLNIFTGDGSGAFTDKISYSAGTSPNTVIAADFNGDGRMDLAVSNYHSDNVSVYLQTVEGVYGPKTDFGVGHSPGRIASGDFNNDGKIDLAVVNGADETVSILIGDGSGSFSKMPTDYAAGSKPIGIATADIDGDNIIDLMITNFDTSFDSLGNVTVLKGNGDGSFSKMADMEVNDGPVGIACGDFNGDGKADLVVANRYGNSVSILCGNGIGGFAPKQNLSAGSSPMNVTSGDFNGDGKADLAVVNLDGSNVSILLNGVEDMEVPNWPDGNKLTISNVGQTSLTLTWTMATDNAGVTGYKILKDGVLYATFGNVLTADVTGLAAGTQYTFKVEACDAAGNWSSAGPAFTVTTANAGVINVPTQTPTISLPVARVLDSGENVIKYIPVRMDNTSEIILVDIDSASLTDVFNMSKADGKGVKTVKADIPEVEGAKAYELIFPASFLTAGDAFKAIEIKTGTAIVTVPGNMFTTKDTTGAQNISLTIAAGDKNMLNDALRAQIGDRPVIELNLKIDGKQTFWSNKSTHVNVDIPYTPTAEELKDPEHITVLHADGSGKAISIPSGRYNPVTGKVNFTTTHFGCYAVASVYKTFSDLGSVEWARKPIEILASKGIINGTGVDTYSPAANISRADYLVLLIKTLGLTADFDSNFDDVGRDTYYYEAIGIAKKLGIAIGIGNNRFNPNENISRQDMMVMTFRTLVKFKELKATSDTGMLDKFSDRGEVAGYAIESLATLVKEGLICGSGNMLNPRIPTTRAEAAVFLYRIYNKY